MGVLKFQSQDAPDPNAAANKAGIFVGKSFREITAVLALKQSLCGWLPAAVCALAIGVNGKAWGACSPGNTGTAGPDVISCDENNDAAGADVESLGGNDTLNLLGGTAANVDAGDGDDEININGAVVTGYVRGGAGNDTVVMDSRDSKVGDFQAGGGIDGGAGDDRIELLDGLAFHVWGGEGDDTILLDGGFVFNYIDAGDGDDTVYWDEGIANEIRMGDGSDQLTLDSFAFEGEAILDGGDDLSADDGTIDTLTFILDHELDGRLLRNWERIVIWGSSKMIFDHELAVGGGADADGNDLGLDILFGGWVEFRPQEFNLTGSIVNAGTVNLQNDRYDSLRLLQHQDGNFGSYLGKEGRLWMDTHLGGDSSPSDLLKVSGDVSGHSSIRVTNKGGIGALTTSDGIKLVEVDGDSPDGAFTLDGNYVAADGQPAAVGGAYAYTLHHNGKTDPADGNWYLRSAVADPDQSGNAEVARWQPGAVLYESYPQALRTLNRPATLRQRVGNRFWVGSSYKDVDSCDYISATERSIDGRGTWLRAAGARNKYESEESTTRAHWEQDLWQVQLGMDIPLNIDVCGARPIVGVFARYGESKTDVDSFFGRGTIDVETYGVGATLTWYNTQGTYVDAQLHFNWFETELDSRELRMLEESADALGLALSFEAGHSFKLHNYYSLTPQAQLIYTREDADGFFDPYDVRLSDMDNDGIRARLGLAVERRVSQPKFYNVSRRKFESVSLERISFYAIANIIYNASDSTKVTVSETALAQDEDDWRGELGFGASYDECDDTCSVYGEINFSTSLDDPGKSNSASATVGFRFKW
jgi:outer membrane autotransporter protein